jgi:succinyl-CoA synthetase beta subunit
MCKYGKWITRPHSQLKTFDVDRKKTREIINRVRGEKRNYLPEIGALEVLNAYNFPTLKSKIAKTADECVETAESIGYPVAMKIVSPDIVHKTEVGGVLVGLRDHSEVLHAYDAMMASVKARRPEARVMGVLVEEMVRGTELIIGSTCDPQFGRMLMFGIGGVFVEVYKDVSFRLVPIADFDAREMIEEIRGKAIFEGARGYPRADKAELARILVGISSAVGKHPEIEELDINPLMVTDRGLMAVDARVILGDLGKRCPA